MADFSQVLGLEPRNANAYFNRGSAYDAMGQVDAAVRDYAAALQLDVAGGLGSGPGQEQEPHPHPPE